MAIIKGNESQVVDRKVKHQSVKWFLPLLALLFFLSGSCGLVYQVLWMRHMSFIFGVTIYAASAVLASFMAGLALGSYFAGRLVDQIRNPLLWYGVAEIFVGLSALLTPLALEWVQQAYVATYPSLAKGFALLTLARFLFSSIVLIVPTTLMGATLPIIIKSSLLEKEGLGKQVSLLYASNTTGAIVGTLLAGFYLIGSLGMSASFKLAAALNIAVGVMAIGAAMVWQRNRQDSPRTEKIKFAEMPDPATELISPRAAKTVLWVFGLSGLTSLALEVIWFRILLLYLEATTYAFTIMLATFLLGIAAGSYLAAIFIRRKINWLKWLALIETAIAIVSLLSLEILSNSPAVFDWAKTRFLGSLTDDLILIIVASFLAIFPSTLLMGIAFPIGLKLWTEQAPEDAGNRSGSFYSLNVLGSIIGSLLAGFLLLPYLGSKVSLILVSGLSLISGLVLLALLPEQQRKFASIAGLGSLAIFIGAALIVRDPFSLILSDRYEGNEILWREEGKQVTVTIQQKTDGKKAMYLDSAQQAQTTAGTIRVHHYIGLLPLLFHPDPQDALAIGLGGGMTVGAMSRYPKMNIDVVELSEAVVHASDWFKEYNYDALRQPNVNLRIDDGRNYLMLTQKRYDAIAADIIRAFHAGSGNLYSAEYYRLAFKALNDDGLMVQWVDTRYEQQYKLVMRTFLTVFPHATLWHNGTILIGSKQPLTIRQSEIERRMQDPVLRQMFESVKRPKISSVLDLYTCGADAMWSYVGDGPILTDDKPLTEFFLSMEGRDKPADLSSLQGDVMRYVIP